MMDGPREALMQGLGPTSTAAAAASSAVHVGGPAAVRAEAISMLPFVSCWQEAIETVVVGSSWKPPSPRPSVATGFTMCRVWGPVVVTGGGLSTASCCPHIQSPPAGMPMWTNGRRPLGVAISDTEVTTSPLTHSFAAGIHQGMVMPEENWSFCAAYCQLSPCSTWPTSGGQRGGADFSCTTGMAYIFKNKKGCKMVQRFGPLPLDEEMPRLRQQGLLAMATRCSSSSRSGSMGTPKQ